MSNKEKRSRLEKLLCILEDSKNDQTLRLAAQKIADVALQQPHHIPSVLRQVHQKLYSKEWKARVYAGDVLGDLAQRVEHCTVECLSAQPPQTVHDTGHSNTLANFSLNAVLRSGTTLVSGNQVSEPEVLSFEDAQAQLSGIKAKFALDIGWDGTHAGVPFNASPSASPTGRRPVVEIGSCTGEELVFRAPKRKRCENEKEGSPAATAAAYEGSQHSLQSARERNRIKRQVKSVERQASGILDTKAPSATALPAASEQSIAAEDEQESERIARGGWPFQRVADQLVANLLDANWQVRHGAAVGLRQLLRAQASSAAVQVPVADALSGWRRRGGSGPMERSEMTPEQRCEAVDANRLWLEDTMAVLLVLLVLDRFADYHNDSATAPVRETAAQAIAIAAAASTQPVRKQLLEQLISMQTSEVWEVRHGSMMCIKCLMAVDTDVAGDMVHRMLPVLMQGMRDSDDDVRASAVQACVPLADTLVQKTPGMVSDLITCLWELLPSFDEVSPAPASVLQLLGILTVHCFGSKSDHLDAPTIKTEGKDGTAESDQTTLCREAASLHTGDGSLGAVKAESDELAEGPLSHGTGPSCASAQDASYLESFTERIPLLWPFFDHSSTQVRTACVSCCTSILQGLLAQPEATARCAALLQTVLRLAYQVFVAAADPVLYSHSEELLRLLLDRIPRRMLAEVLDAATLYALMDLPCTPVGSKLPPDRLLRFPLSGVASKDGGIASGGLGGIVSFRFGEQSCTDVENSATARRIACARMVGLAASATAGVNSHADTNMDVQLTAQNFSNLIATFLYSNIALQRGYGALVMMAWMQLHGDPTCAVPEDVKAPLFKALEEASTVALQETAAPMELMHSRLAQTLEAFAVAGTPIQLPPEVTLQSVTTVYATDILNSLDVNYGDVAIVQRQACRDAVSHAEAVDKVTRLRLTAVVAAACVACQRLPDKVSTVIQPLMAGLRNIQEGSLQNEVVAAALANVVTMCLDRKPAAVDKVLSHLRSFACASPSLLQSQPSLSKASFSSASFASFTLPPATSLPSNAYCAAGGPNDGGQKPPNVVAKEGAQAALQHVVSRLGAALPDRLPQLWAMLTCPVLSLAESWNVTDLQKAETLADSDAAVAASCFAVPGIGELAAAGSGLGNMKEAQMAADAMQLLHCIAPALDVQLHVRLAGNVPQMMACMVHVPAEMREVVCGGVVQLTSSEPPVYLDAVVTVLLPCLEATAAARERVAGTLLLAQLLAVEGSLMMPLLPYVALLTVPTLALMTDPEVEVRTTAAAAFGHLMSILPMAVNQPLPELATLDAKLREKRENDLRFLEQLMDTQSVAAFEPPVPPQGVTLRAYQREGVSWLSFLQNFGLHGVLADDMGLGKTVQTLTIIACSMAASDAPESLHAPSSAAGRRQLPSLIVCPATLLGHWVQETKRYFGHVGLGTVRYQGTVEQRQAMQRQVRGAVLVVASYESVRADVAWFAGMRFQYCALDEGHIIRNSKTKVTKACKQIVANHRLVLSGTPVQNHVTELWSIFDFLMPGYLGTEPEFNSKYRRAATMPKDNSRKSSREKHLDSQLGALDSLHKQILPFVLRRTKEQVLDDLPPKIIQDIVCELTPLQQRLYEVAMAGTSLDPGAVAASARGEAGQAAAPVFNALLRLRKLCSHPSLMLDLQDRAHVAALRDSFPSLDVNSRTAVDAELANIEQAPKLLALRQLLSNAGIIMGGGNCSAGSGDGESDAAEIAADTGQHRVLCFAQMKGTLDLVESVVLDPEGVSYLRLDGDVSPAKRSDVVHQFNTDPTVDVMLLTTAAGCHGLNLTTANVVVFLEHDWNPMKDLQAMDRAHRLGQRRTVTVYRLLTEGTLEEHIMSLQQFKVDVANTVVNADNVAMDSMDTGAVLDLMAKDGAGQGAQPGSSLAGAGKNGGSQIMTQPEQGDTAAEEYNEFSIEQFMHTIRPKRRA